MPTVYQEQCQLEDQVDHIERLERDKVVLHQEIERLRKRNADLMTVVRQLEVGWNESHDQVSKLTNEVLVAVREVLAREC